jgi:hypothetical protein
VHTRPTMHVPGDGFPVDADIARHVIGSGQYMLIKTLNLDIRPMNLAMRPTF